MKGATILAIVLYGLLELGAAYALTEETASAQSYAAAPARGCAGVAHWYRGSPYRVYGCDGNPDPCIYAPHVNTCPPGALIHREAVSHTLRIRGRNHLVRFYNEIAEACYFLALQPCCGSTQPQPGKRSVEMKDDYECKSVTLPTGEIIYDPLDCAPSSDMEIETRKEEDEEKLIEALEKLVSQLE